MANTTLVLLENAFKTTIVGTISSVATSVTLATAPRFTVPAGKKIPMVLDPRNALMEVAYITAIAGAVLTIERGKPMYQGDAGTAYQHAGGAVAIIGNPFNVYKDMSDAIDSKLGNDGSNPTTTFDLDLSGSLFRIRKDGNDMKFTDDNQAEVSLSQLASLSGVNDKVKSSATDTTSKYLGAAIEAGPNVTIEVINPGGNEKVRITSASAPHVTVEHDKYTPAFLTGGTSAESNPAIWDSVSDGSFAITIDGVAYNITGLDFSSITTMANVATVIQTAIRNATGNEETCVWSTNKFIISSVDITSASAITVTSAVAPPTGTDISGAGTVYMDCETGRGTVTNKVLDPTSNDGDAVGLNSSGLINSSLLEDQINGITSAVAGETITVSGNPVAVFIAADTSSSADEWDFIRQYSVDDNFAVYGARWVGNSFVAKTDNITKLRLQLDEAGTSVGNLTVAIYATAAGVPTGAALGSVNLAGTSVADADADHLFTFASPVAVTKGSTYAIVVTLINSVNSSNCVQVNFQSGGTPFSGGSYMTSTDSGANWTPVATDALYMEVWGYDNITANRCYISDPAHFQRSQFTGFVSATTASAATASIKTKYADGFTGLTDKADYSITTGGAVTNAVSIGYIGKAAGTTAISIDQSGDRLIGEYTVVQRTSNSINGTTPYTLISAPTNTRKVEWKLTNYVPDRSIFMVREGSGATETIDMDSESPNGIITWTKSTRAMVFSMSDSSASGTIRPGIFRFYK